MTNKVESKRIIYNPSEFAKKSLIYLQETGISKTNRLNTNSRDKLDSYLFFIVTDGTGTITYNNKTTNLVKGSCVFIDCNNKYSHTSDNWTIKWVHFNGNNVKDIFNKYKTRNGQDVFNTNNLNKYKTMLDSIQLIANSNDYIKDIIIYEKLTGLISLIMSETINNINNSKERIYDVTIIKEYIDSNYLKGVALEELSKKYYINKFYLTKLFKNTYGLTINNYIINKKITKAKELLRYSDLSIENIAIECGIKDNNYFSRAFRKVEGFSPKEYRNKW